MAKRVLIDPVTRLEGHGKIDILLDDQGNVTQAYFQIPELRGFEKFCEGRPAEDMPQITSRICGVCPSAHHMGATKALDALFGVVPPAAARLIREVFYSLFMFEDHLLHFFFLGGPDFIVGPAAPKASRNILGVIDKVGLETGKKVIEIRKRCRELMAALGGKPIHPVLGLPGGVSKPMDRDLCRNLACFAKDAVAFAQFTLKAFFDLVWSNPEYRELVLSDIYQHRTYYLGMVDSENRVSFYDGPLRVVDPEGKEVLRFNAKDYLTVIAEQVESWSYIKFPYLRQVGWKGFTDGLDSGVFRVAPLARLNAAEGMATPLAQAEYQAMFAALGGKPAHHTLAIHWARLIEVLYAAEHLQELAADERILSPNIRNLDLQTPSEGIGIVEAPRGTLIHHYHTDEKGLIQRANLIVASQNNAAAMCLSIDKAAKALICNGQVNDGLLNQVEMAFRAYDPCFGCATHSLPGKMPLEIRFRDTGGQIRRRLIRDASGGERLLEYE
ncbi:Ni/Fe hydrogenase subunit alpha [candidate division FCPU426 bacterium]|nr:Ni/Fe hydrogenase subunit alpha [candidate division FCPU426 bacterium]